MINDANTLDLPDLDDIQDPIMDSPEVLDTDPKPELEPDPANHSDDFDLTKELLTL
jgi:hypothetical protein